MNDLHVPQVIRLHSKFQSFLAGHGLDHLQGQQRRCTESFRCGSQISGYPRMTSWLMPLRSSQSSMPPPDLAHCACSLQRLARYQIRATVDDSTLAHAPLLSSGLEEGVGGRGCQEVDSQQGRGREKGLNTMKGSLLDPSGIQILASILQ